MGIQYLLLILYCVFTSRLQKDFLFTKSISSSTAAVMEYSCNLQLQYNIYRNDIINHYGEGNGSAALQTPLSCEQPFLLSLRSTAPPPVRFFLLLVSFIAVQCLFISGFVNEVFATKVIEISRRDPRG